MISPVYIFYKGKVHDILPDKVWTRYSYFEIVEFYGFTESAKFDWWCTHDAMQDSGIIKRMMKRTA